MINNRIRTAAIAGVVAVATSLSGFSVPAMAAENAGNHFNVADASAPQAGLNKTEENLKAANDKVSEFLKNEVKDRDLRRVEILNDYASKNPANVLDPSEKAAYDAWTQRKVEVTNELAVAAKNIADARAAVRVALDADEAAERAQAAYNKEFKASGPALDAAAKKLDVKALNKLIKKANEEDTTAAKPSFTELPTDTKKLTGELALQLLTEIDAAYANAAATEDPSAADYVSRDFIKAVDALAAEASLKTFKDTNAAIVAKLADLAKKMFDANLEAQRSDVLVRQSLLNQAYAQAQALRAVEADYAAVSRYVELYENDNLYEDQKEGWTTLRPKFFDLQKTTGELVPTFAKSLDDANQAVTDVFKTYEGDLKNAAEKKAYAEAKLAMANQVYKNIINNGEWQMAAEKAQLLDAKFFVKNDVVPPADKPKEPVKPVPPADGSFKFDLKGLGIFAVIAAVIGLIAAAFPAIAHMLPKH